MVENLVVIGAVAFGSLLTLFIQKLERRGEN